LVGSKTILHSIAAKEYYNQPITNKIDYNIGEVKGKNVPSSLLREF